MTGPALLQPWGWVGNRRTWRAQAADGSLLTVSRSVEGQWHAYIDELAPDDPRGVPPRRSGPLRTRLIAQRWAELQAAKAAAR